MSIAIFFWAVIPFFNQRNNKPNILEERFILGCINNIGSKKFNFKEKRILCKCNHDYLLKKYDSIIYEVNFSMQDKEDSLKIIECLKIVNQGIN